MNWNTFDLNLLTVFDAVMQERNLTRAGQKLGLSQSAVSYALARLRHTLNDELFVRGSDSMLPTPRAERISGPIHEALQDMRVTLESGEFDAAHAARTFTITANNYAALAVVPALARRIATMAPSVVLEVRPIGRIPILDQLDHGTVELALSTLIEGGERFKCARLLIDEFVALLSNGLPIAGVTALSIEQFARVPHIAVTSIDDDTGFVDEALAGYGLARVSKTKVPLHSLWPVLTDSGALAVVPWTRCDGGSNESPLAHQRTSTGELSTQGSGGLSHA